MNTSRARWCAGLSLLSAVWIGCNGENQEVGFAGGQVTPETLPDVYAGIFCDTLTRCCSPSETIIGTCRQKVAENMTEEMESIKSGRSTFDSAAAATCVAALQSGFADCVLSPDEAPESCDKTLVGVGKEGDSCEAAYQCSSGLDCFLSSVDGRGHCATFAQLGEPCGEKQCALGKGLACSQASEGTSRVCSQAAAMGESCKSINCAEGFYCNRQVSPPTCAAQGAASAACKAHEQCLSIACSNGTCVAEGSICSMFGLEAPPRPIRRRPGVEVFGFRFP